MIFTTDNTWHLRLLYLCELNTAVVQSLFSCPKNWELSGQPIREKNSCQKTYHPSCYIYNLPIASSYSITQRGEIHFCCLGTFWLSTHATLQRMRVSKTELGTKLSIVSLSATLCFCVAVFESHWLYTLPYVTKQLFSVEAELSGHWAVEYSAVVK